MHTCAVGRLRPGLVLAEAIHDGRGELLLNAGTELTQDYIARLARRGVTAVRVRDGLADDLPPAALVAGEVRAAATRNLARVFDHVSAMSRELFGEDGGPHRVDDVLAALGERPLPLPSDGAAAVLRLYDDVEALITEILDGTSVASLESLKSHSGYTFEHSVDVAVIAVVLGKELGLAHDRLREIALGGLLHDLGMMYIDDEVLARPGPLRPEEREEVRKHPLLGFELVRRMPLSSIIPAHVAYQHHERQDGGGYPRGLEGTNRVTRGDQRVDARRMLLAAEIAAVADVYSAVTSERPYRGAAPPDAALKTLRDMAGRGLNHELVAALTRQLPPYPVGHWVVVTDGPWRGWRGVVAHVRRGELDSPDVSLRLDAAGEPVEPRDLHLATVPAGLRCLAPHEAPAASAQSA